MTSPQPTELDPDAVNLAKAIRQTESGGNFQAKGKSGEYGAYQFTSPTWSAASQKYLGQNIPLDQATPEQQNEVAYKQIKEWKDGGNNVGQIASMWNAGEKHKNAYLDQSYKGINESGASYNVPQYAKSVATAYQSIKQGVSVGADPNNPSSISAPSEQPQDPSLGQELTQRGTDVVNAIGQAGQGVSDLSQGNVLKAAENIGSGTLQAAGGVAGGIGDIAQKATELIPGVKWVESGIGKALGAVANTSLGKQVVGGIHSFIKTHPEAAANIQSAVNIASVIPLFKAVGLAYGAAKDAVGSALSGTLEKAAGNEIEGVAMNTVGGRALLNEAESRGFDPITKILESGALPSVEEDAAGTARYATENAFAAMSTEPEEAQLQQTLARVGSSASLEESRKSALSAIEDTFKNSPNYDAMVQKTNDIFNSYISRYGDTPSWNDLNDIKRGIRESVNFNSPKLESDLHYTLGQSLMDDIEEGAKKQGVTEVSDINQQMAQKIQAQKLLKLMDGSKVKVSSLGKWARRIKMGLGAGAGNVAGNALGIPFAGSLAGTLLESGAAQPRTALTRLANIKPLSSTLPTLAKKSAQGLLPQLLRNKQEAK